MKKGIASFLAAILIVATFAGCNQQEPAESSGTGITTTAARTTVAATTTQPVKVDTYGLLKDLGDEPVVSTPGNAGEEALTTDGKWMLNNHASFEVDHLIINTNAASVAAYMAQPLGDTWKVSTNFRPLVEYVLGSPTCSRIFLLNSSGDPQIILTTNVIMTGSVMVELQMQKDGGWESLYLSPSWQSTTSTKFHMELSREKGSKKLHFIVADESMELVNQETTVELPDELLDSLLLASFVADHTATEFFDMSISGNGPESFEYKG